jgi:hypothetical protein
MATLKNTTVNDTGYLQLPVGNTAERPVSPTNGMMRYNTTTASYEAYVAGIWITIVSAPLTIEYLVVAGGGGGGAITAGGGGAGGFLTGTVSNLLTNIAYAVTVGTGGAGATADTGNNSNSKGVSGSNSIFNNIIAAGGGGGGAIQRLGLLMLLVRMVVQVAVAV